MISFCLERGSYALRMTYPNPLSHKKRQEDSVKKGWKPTKNLGWRKNDRPTQVAVGRLNRIVERRVFGTV
jgi:hypothetical protein